MAIFGPYKPKKGVKPLGVFEDGLERKISIGETPSGLDMNTSISFVDIAKLGSMDQIGNAAATVGKVVDVIKEGIGAIGFDLFKYGSEQPTQPQSEAEAKKIQAQNEAVRVNQWNREVSQSQFAEFKEHEARPMISDQRGTLNDLLGLSNGSYEISIGQDGKPTDAYHQAVAEQEKQGRIADEKREADKANILAMASGKGKSMGGTQATDNLNQAGETFDQNKTRFTG